MTHLRKFWREMFDIRAGEYVQTWAMFAYLFAVLMAYYIVKPVSRSMFLTKFDVEKLPSLYIVIAVAGGVFAYVYGKVAARTSLHTAVFWTMFSSIISLFAMSGPTTAAATPFHPATPLTLSRSQLLLSGTSP